MSVARAALPVARPRVAPRRGARAARAVAPRADAEPTSANPTSRRAALGTCVAAALAALSPPSLAAGAAGGFSAYLAVSNTAIHLKCGGTSRASCYAAAAVAALFVALPQLFAVVGYVPTLVVTAGIVTDGRDASVYRISVVSPAKSSGVLWKHCSVTAAPSSLTLQSRYE